MALLEANPTPIPENLIHVTPLRIASNRWIYNTQAEEFVKSFLYGVAGCCFVGRFRNEGTTIYGSNRTFLHKNAQT
jgi:hypothetical protein